MTSVLHVIPTATSGGGPRAVRNLLRALESCGLDLEVISLGPVDPAVGRAFADAGHALADLGVADARRRLAGAEIVHLHFWNSPETYELLRGRWPACRLVVWTHVGGGTDPQFVSPRLADFADCLVGCSAHTGELDQLRGRAVGSIEALTDPGRMTPLPRVAHDGTAFGYIGTVEPVKMHPDFIDLNLAADAPDARFVVCGDGPGLPALRRAARRAGAEHRFAFVGYSDPAPVLAGLDVLVNPLCPDTYAACDLVLQEAMFAGLPSVVLPYGGGPHTVIDGETGLVASDEAAYPGAVERLARDPELRRRLGDQAREHAAERWSFAKCGGAWADVYSRLLEEPKRERGWGEPPPVSGAEAFVATLGPAAERFRASLDGDADADEWIAESTPAIGWSTGGVLDYRRRYPDDPYLRLWSGLVLGAAGRNALAAGELTAALRGGIERERLDRRLATLTGPAAGA